MTVSLDLARAFKTVQKGDILAVLTWVNDERALVLMPALRRVGAPWFVLCESALYRYDDPRYMAMQCARAAEVLGMDETSSSAFRIAEIIHNYTPDLIRMPPAPPSEKTGAAIGEMHLREEGKTIHSDVVRLGQGGADYA